MKSNVKCLVSALAGFVLGGATIVGANQAIQAIQNTQIKVSLNGQIQEFKDETTGEVQYPITYHDRTYLPLRNVAQLAGLEVSYDNNTNTAILNSAVSVPDAVKKAFEEKMSLEPYFNEDFTSVHYDVDGDGIEEFIYITNYYGEKNLHIFKSNGDELENDINNSIYQLEIRKNGKEAVLFAEVGMSDGICYELKEFVVLRINNNVVEKSMLASCTCDQEEEEKIRSSVRHSDGTPLSDEEEIIYENAHILKYESKGKRITKEEFEAIISNFENEYQLVKKIK